MEKTQIENLVVTRVLKATPEKVYKAWTDPALIAKWFYPNERWDRCDPEVEPMVGGKYNITMVHSDGDKVGMKGKVVEMVSNEKLVFTFLDKDSDDFSQESVVTVTLKAVAEGTELTLVHSKLASADLKSNVSQGWDGCLNMLGNFIQA